MTDSNHTPSDNDQVGWFEQPKNINRIIIGLVVACVLSLVFELLFGHSFHDEHHPTTFKTEEVFGYQAWIGFIAFVAAVGLGSLLRLVIRRPGDYYDQ